MISVLATEQGFLFCDLLADVLDDACSRGDRGARKQSLAVDWGLFQEREHIAGSRVGNMKIAFERHRSRREGSRGISLLNQPAHPVSLPIIGTVRAGTPELATEDILGFFQIDAAWLSGAGNFILKVKGDSMKDAGIYNNDYAIIRPQATADNGQIVVALIDGEATLKRFYKEQDYIRLQPENAAMEPIIIRPGESETVIAGKLLKTIRFFD